MWKLHYCWSISSECSGWICSWVDFAHQLLWQQHPIFYKLQIHIHSKCATTTKKPNKTDLTPQNLDLLWSKSLSFSANWFPWPSDPPLGSCSVGSRRHTGTSSHCPGTQTGPPHYNRCSWERPLQSEPSDTLAERPEDLQQGRKWHSCVLVWNMQKSLEECKLCPPFFKRQHMFSVTVDVIDFAYGFIYTALFRYSCCKSLLGFTSALCRHPWQKKKKKSLRVIEAKFVLTLWCCSYKLAGEQTMWQFHQKLREFNYGCPTLQMNLVFRALNQNGADRIKVVIVTASERACSCFGHLKGEKKAHNNSFWERNQHITFHTNKEME